MKVKQSIQKSSASDSSFRLYRLHPTYLPLLSASIFSISSMAPVKALLLCYLAVVHQFVVTLAAPLEERGGSVCSSGIYGELAPILEQYSIAEEFCSVVYPVSCTASSTSPTKNKRAVSSTTSTSKAPTTTSTLKATSSSQTTSAADSKASAWSKCQQQPWNVISTLCSCIETPTVCFQAAYKRNTNVL